MYQTRSRDGTRLALHRLRGHGDRALLIVHATGFTSKTYLEMVRSLSLPPDLQVIGLDLRGHGSSGLPASEELEWEYFGDDVLSAIGTLADLGITTSFAFGHSCGAAALLIAGTSTQPFVKSCYLFEPIVSTPEALQPPNTPNPLSLGAARRRRSFPSVASAIAHYSSRPPLSHFDAACLADYVSSAFHDDDNGITLNCPREIESAIYANGAAHHTYEKLASWPYRATIAYGSQTEVFDADHFRRIAAQLPHGHLEVVTDLGHFAPMNDPRTMAQHLSNWIASSP